jgi:1-deoxy-D-xylulose-5-phosphate synthase
VTLVNARFAKPMDAALLAELADDHAIVLSAEDHALPGGFGSVVAETIADRGLPLTLQRMGVRDELIPHAGREQQLADQGLSRAGIAARLRRLLGLGRDGTIPFTRTG